MHKKNRIIGAIAGGVLALSGGGAATAFGLSNEVNIDVYGEVSTVRTFDNNVESILDNKGVKIDKVDKVTPALNDKVSDGETIIVEKLNLVKLVIDDQKPKQFATGVKTVGEVVEGAGYDFNEVQVSLPAEAILQPGKEARINITTPKTVTFTGKNGEYVATDVFHDTVGEAAEAYLQDFEKTDALTPGRDTEIVDGMTIDITRIRTAERTETEEVPFKKTTKEDSAMFVDEQKVTTKGVNGVKTKTIKDTLVDGKVTESEIVKDEIATKPVDEVLSKGTKERPAPVVEEKEEVESAPEKKSDKSAEKSSGKASGSSKGSSEKSSKSSNKSSRSSERSSAPAKSSGNGSGLLAGIPQWKIDRFDQLAQCESGGNWSINTSNNYFGGIQFNLQSWKAAGGTKYAPRPDLATREQQIAAGAVLQSMQGWGAWPACSSKYGYI